MAQPLPRKIKVKNPEFAEKPFNTLLVDGSNILELSSLGDKSVSSNGERTGGIFQFFLQISLLLKKYNFRHVYVFWDDSSSGLFRYLMNSDYKGTRDKHFEIEEGLSDYMKTYNENLRRMQNYIYSKRKSRTVTDEMKENKRCFFKHREVIIKCLEELFIRQCLCEKVEADDLIAYYVKNKQQNEKIVIMSNDRDLTQLISDDVIVYVQQKKKFINTKNCVEELGVHHSNIVLKKMICGDNSDNIRGVLKVGEKTFLREYPELMERKVTLEEVIDKAKKLNEERERYGRPPIQWAYNIEHGINTGAQGNRLYEINEKIIDLSEPLMTDEARETMDSIMHQPLDPEGRSMTNLYSILMEAGVDNFKDPDKFARFFEPFQNVIEEEKKKKC